MQKKLIALAVAGLVSGAAFAQSNVTIYGVMDATYDNVSATGASNNRQGNGTNTYDYPSRGRTTFNSSYIGFKGSESLGNGLTAVFQIETGISETASTGSFGAYTAGTGAWATRDTMVALAGGFGTVAFGNLTGPTRLLGGVMDVNSGATGIGANSALLGKLGGGSGAGYFDQRIANAIAYISPTFGGFYGVIGYLPNENRGTSAANTAPVAPQLTNNAQPNTEAWTLGGVYGNGPILAGLTYTTVKDKNCSGTACGFRPTTFLANYAGNALGAATAWTNGGVATPISKIDNTRLGFKYDFGMATVGIMYDYTKATIVAGSLAATLNDKDAKQTVWYIPVTVKLGNGKLIGQYGWAANVKGSLVDLYNNSNACSGGTSCDFKAKHFMVGYEYNMSKRTMLKAVWSQISNNKDAGYDYLYGVSASNTTAYGAGMTAGSDPRGLSVGLRHSF